MRRGKVVLPELELLELIAKSIDPRTGQSFTKTPRNGALNASRDRYLDDLRRVNRLLRQAEKGDPVAVWATRNKVGKRWTADDDRKVQALWSDPRQLTAQAVGVEVGRSSAGILSRLVTLGVVADAGAAEAEDDKRYALIPKATPTRKRRPPQ